MKHLSLGLSLLLYTSWVMASHTIEYRVSPVGNLVYQLDCKAQVARFRCSQSDFQALWQGEIQADEADAAMLQQWQVLRSQLDETIELEEQPAVAMVTSPNFPINAAQVLNVLEKVRIMAFEAPTLTEYQRLSGLLLSPSHVQAEQAILQHFWPRFASWFNQQQAGLQSFVTEAETLSEQVQLDQLLSAMRTFYRAQLPSELVLPVHLIAHPQVQAPTSGLVFGQHSLIEVLQGEKAAQRLAVVVHEIAHFYHERATLDHHLKTMNHFSQAESPTGLVGYYLFNEAMASAIGNGYLEQRLSSPEYFAKYLAYPLSFYANAGIDTASKAALDLVTEYLKQNRAVDTEFLQRLDAIWGTSLKDLRDSPSERLRHVGMVILGDDQDALINELFGMIRPSSAHINHGSDVQDPDFVLHRYARMDAVIVAESWDQVTKLNLPGLPTTPPHEEAVVVKTPAGAVRVILVSPNQDAVISMLQTILAQPHF
ncbi:hypothetical protein [Marinicella meishanensis]|uniref:hypothetical protein n=1 Tax=Marinicella meishanensis TaxID=2873263 RepID=UPI001CBB4311|nr:hypothetical protein [Marinicella sp. NBU2979]